MLGIGISFALGSPTHHNISGRLSILGTYRSVYVLPCVDWNNQPAHWCEIDYLPSEAKTISLTLITSAIGVNHIVKGSTDHT